MKIKTLLAFGFLVSITLTPLNSLAAFRGGPYQDPIHQQTRRIYPYTQNNNRYFPNAYRTLFHEGEDAFFYGPPAYQYISPYAPHLHRRYFYGVPYSDLSWR